MQMDRLPLPSHSARESTDIYLPIDAIFDTRIGVIADSDPALASKILSSGKYFNRKFDEFDGLSNEEFKKLYAARNSDVLPLCLVTNVSFFLQRLVKDALVVDAMSPNDDRIVIHLNVSPYTDLTQEEVDAFRDCLRLVTMSYCDINVVNIPLKDLTPLHCKKNYDIMVMYEYEEFFLMHEAALAKCHMPEVSLVVPKMYRSKLPTPEEAQELSIAGNDLLSVLEHALIPLIGLKMLDVSLFCISEKINPSNKEVVMKTVAMTEEYITELAAKSGLKTDIATVNPETIPEPVDRNSEQEYTLL